MSCLPKPVLRGHLKRQGVRNILVSFCLGSLASTFYYFTVALPRENAYINFMKTYDPEEHYKDMVKWGYMQCVGKSTKND